MFLYVRSLMFVSVNIYTYMQAFIHTYSMHYICRYVNMVTDVVEVVFLQFPYAHSLSTVLGQRAQLFVYLMLQEVRQANTIEEYLIYSVQTTIIHRIKNLIQTAIHLG